MKKRSGVVLAGRALGLVWGAFILVAACSKSSHSTSSETGNTGDAGVRADAGCTPGEKQDCTYDQLCTGSATCLPDGTVGPCECDSVPNDGSGGIVGSRCDKDADCGSGGTCFTAESKQYLGAGGPAGGYCTFVCVTNGDCTDHDAQSECQPIGPNGAAYCLRTCLSQEAEPGEGKCLNRPDLVCDSIAADGVAFISSERQPGHCLPRCGSDADCPTGLVCHRQAGICTSFPPPGNPVGSACSLETDCDGHECEDRDSAGVGTCTALCTLGALSGCGYARDSSARGAACLTAKVQANRFSEGSGDVGLCRELCDVDSDCIQAAHGFGCVLFSDAAAAFFGRAGACGPQSSN